MRGTFSMAGRSLPAVLLGLSLSACVGTAYSGPIEVTRFVAQEGAPVGQGSIAITFPKEMSNARARDAFYRAVASELTGLGYTIIDGAQSGIPTARVVTSRSALAPASSRGPVNVGVGGGTGSFGSGLGVGIGIDLGGNSSRPNALSELSVRISDRQGNSLWEGRAQQAISINSPYADVEASAGALAAALFKDFPGGNGETVTIKLDELQDQ
ncbi:MAG: hypothetical protein AAGI28_05140 [Pseudomonadota bacterium]